ncbi:MAG: hypothetical protein MUP14_00310 [Dehalococcoidia bacterium]|nr:hypothetical protein [Dehalococcoidia bacterium]
MSQTRILLTLVVLPLLFVAFAACGGGGEEKATQTPASPTTGTPTQAAEITPSAPTFSGSATASVTVGDQSLTFKNGRCDTGPDDVWLAVNIGQPGGDEYFGLVVGTPTGEEGVGSAKGGGVFTGKEIVAVTGTSGGISFSMMGSEGNKVTVDADLKGGEFVGTTIEGEAVSGSFKC